MTQNKWISLPIEKKKEERWDFYHSPFQLIGRNWVRKTTNDVVIRYNKNKIALIYLASYKIHSHYVKSQVIYTFNFGNFHRAEKKSVCSQRFKLHEKFLFLLFFPWTPHGFMFFFLCFKITKSRLTSSH